MGRSRNQYDKKGRGSSGESRRDRRITHFISSSEQSLQNLSLDSKDDSAASNHHSYEGEDEGEEEEEMVVKSVHIMSIPIKLWEFGQNDPKKDSGSRLTRLGLAQSMKVGSTFNGIVLSSETNTYISKTDFCVAQAHGIAGINCSWNRLKEIPFEALGRDRNQRILPYLLAANSINYGRPYKLNTAEAIAAALYIIGCSEDARHIMMSFNYGPEFFRMNSTELELYASCNSSAEVKAASQRVIRSLELKKEEREMRKEKERVGCGISTDYTGMPDYEEEEEYEEEEDEVR